MVFWKRSPLPGRNEDIERGGSSGFDLLECPAVPGEDPMSCCTMDLVADFRLELSILGRQKPQTVGLRRVYYDVNLKGERKDDILFSFRTLNSTAILLVHHGWQCTTDQAWSMIPHALLFLLFYIPGCLQFGIFLLGVISQVFVDRVVAWWGLAELKADRSQHPRKETEYVLPPKASILFSFSSSILITSSPGSSSSGRLSPGSAVAAFPRFPAAEPIIRNCAFG